MMLFFVLSYLITPSSSKASTAEEELKIARQSLFDCQMIRVQEIDNYQSDARVIALRLTNLCLGEYKALNRITAQENFDNSNEKRMFTIDQNSKIFKIDASLPVVMMNRQGNL